MYGVPAWSLSRFWKGALCPWIPSRATFTECEGNPRIWGQPSK